MSNQNLGKKLKCANCKKSKSIGNYSKRQLEQKNGRKCVDCCSAASVANLSNSPETQTGRRQGDEHLNAISFDGEYYTSFNPDKSKRSARKKEDRPRIDNDLHSPSNPLGINQYTDAAKPFIYLSAQVQQERLREVKEDLIHSCNDVLFNLLDVDLQTAAKHKYLSGPYDKDKQQHLDEVRAPVL